MTHLRTLAILAGALIFAPLRMPAQEAISVAGPVTCHPGETTRLTLAGKSLAGTVRIATSRASAEAKVVSVEGEKALLDLTLPADAPPGPLGLWVATDAGPFGPLVVLVDDLPAVADNGANHSRETAQSVPAYCAVDGASEGPQLDFYRITVEAGQRVAFEMHTQALRSKMDPVLRLLDGAGRVLYLADDANAGPECRFSHQFAEAGEYWLEVSDSRFAAGGAYHLRMGDFPIVRHAYPLALRRGETARVSFDGEDGAMAISNEVSVPEDAPLASVTVTAKLPGGRSSAWSALLVRDAPQFIEPQDANGPSGGQSEPIAFPAGISGRLDQPGQRDTYSIKGTKGQVVRVTSRTRSLGSSAALHMQLLDAAGAKVAETAVTEADEWSFDYTFPDDGVYRLEVRDLLNRGGAGYGYWIDLQPAGSIAIALKADAATRELFAVEPAAGGAVFDLTVSRFGDDRPLTLQSSDPRFRILNPAIAAGAAEVRVFVVPAAEWKPDAAALIGLTATREGDAAGAVSVSSAALHRLKEPHVLYSGDWNEETLFLAGVPSGAAFFALEPAAPARFARPVKSCVVTFNLKRLNAEFKGAPTILGSDLPSGWELSAKTEQDVCTVTFTRGAAAVGEPTSLPLLAAAEHNGRVRVERIDLPIEWFDPLQLAIEAPKVLVPGQPATINVSLTRTGDAQPVTVKLADAPPGVTGPADGIVVPADQSTASFDITVAPDSAAAAEVALGLQATGQYAGAEFTASAASNPVSILPLPTGLEVYPASVTLDGRRSRQQLVVTGTDKAGMSRDWSRDVRVTSANAAIAEVRGNVIHPVAAGTTEVIVELGTIRTTVPVNVALPETARPIAFESEVLVALSKQGCNSGACHGSPSGKGGFRLSLRAFDKQLDELTLIREDFGRRVNPLDPERSLLLAKPLMKVPHGGGMQLHLHDEAHAILRDWIGEGARSDPADAPRCVRLEVFPPTKRVAELVGGGQQFAVAAHFADGSRRDVTHLVAWESSNTSVATVNGAGLVTPTARGETVILARFLEHIESVPLMFVEDVDGFAWSAPPENNYIDALVHEKLRQLRYLPAATCDDAVFLRRTYLDVIGILPTVEEGAAFLADTSADKRSRLIDELLERDEHARFWALKWGDLLRMTAKTVGDEGVYKYHRWVEQAIRSNMPYDEFARALLTGSGSTFAEPPANFYRTATDMNECVETVSQVFLGARLQCAKCHNHPFERWTQDNYYGLGAFFNRVQRRKTQRTGEMFVWYGADGEVTQPRTGRVMQPWLPQVGEITVAADEDRRTALAKWLTDPANPFFAKVEANRIWSQLFARGIVDPIDDFRDSNPPSNDRLLDALARDFAESGFDRKHLLRTILNSHTYQADYDTNPFNATDTLYFSHQQPRMLSAEQLLDAVNQASGLTQTFAGLPPGTRATHLPAPDIVKVEFLKVFGQPERSTVCACERADDSNLGMAIELFNGALIHEKLRDPNNRFRKAVAAGRPVEDILWELYLASVCRPPTQAELETALAHCRQREDVAAGLEDVCWALFNTDEFLFQH